MRGIVWFGSDASTSALAVSVTVASHMISVSLTEVEFALAELSRDISRNRLSRGPMRIIIESMLASAATMV